MTRIHLLLLLFVTLGLCPACGGGVAPDGRDDGGEASSNWDEMKWDEGVWG